MRFLLILLLCFFPKPANAHGMRPQQASSCRRLLNQLSEAFLIPRWRTLGSVRVVDVPLKELFKGGFAHLSVPREIVTESGVAPTASYEDIRLYLLRELQSAFPNYKISIVPGVNAYRGSALPWHQNWQWSSLLDLAHRPSRDLTSLQQVSSFRVRATLPVRFQEEPPMVVWPMEGPYASRAIQPRPGFFTLYLDSTLTSQPRRRKEAEPWIVLIADFLFER